MNNYQNLCFHQQYETLVPNSTVVNNMTQNANFVQQNYMRSSRNPSNFDFNFADL